MDRLVYHNDRIQEASNVRLDPTIAGTLYGWGVFTYLRIYEGTPFAFDRHWDRLTKNAERSHIPLSISSEGARQAIRDLIYANRVTNGRARMTLLRGAAGAWTLAGESDCELLVFTSSEPALAPSEVAITISPYRILSHGPLAGVKKTAMIENVLALEEARSRGFAEAVMVNERGEIAGATTANIFWAERDELFTPSLATGCIPGITRSFALEIAARAGLHTVEGGFPVQRLLGAREAFLTSTTRGLARVASFDVKQYRRKEARVMDRVSREFQKLVREC